ncbi:MAG: Zinc/iron permease [Linnemannia elongata]|nr:MAG: Zinc/iron permease [Linnemannia elongata]
MDPFFSLILLCIAMLIASFLAGNVPLSFHLSEDRLKLISNFGVGLLVGTSLVVIIPEGVETLYSTPKPATSFEDNMAATLLDRASIAKRLEVGEEEGAIAQKPAEQEQEQEDDVDNDSERQDAGHAGNGDEGEEEEEEDAHKYIGLALLSGFILMFLIDQMGPTHAHSHNNHVSVADFTELHNLQLDDNNIRMPSAAGMNAGGGKKRGNPITIGLVVHAAADGIALGASASRPELRFIVFLAIMLHKAPAAFGLSTVLLQHGFSRRQTRQQVGIFALAAPIGALLTYIFIQLSGHREEASLHWWTGMLLLFSGGTFLYVAMHVMSEMNNTEKSSGSNGYSVGGAGGDKGLSVVDVLCVIGGMVVPLILSVDHEH